MSGTNEFYIIVKKDTNGTLSIVDKDDSYQLPILEQNNIPTKNITDTNTSDIFFAVKVSKNGTENSFPVNGVTYSLNLSDKYTPNDIQFMIGNGATLNMLATQQGGQNQVNVQQEVDGGQKEKHKNHNKRSYSKKNRKSRSKSDTLRNYFNYSAIETM